MPKRAPSVGRTAIIAGFALSCFALMTFLWVAFGGALPLGPKGYRFQVSFPDAATLADQADVRVAGVNIGKVVVRQRDPAGNRQLATIEIDERFAPVRRDAKALLRQKTLLGETYVEIDLGTKGTPTLPEGDRLPDTAVAEAVEFDELLTTFDAPTRRAFQQWQRSTAQATKGRAADLSDALGSLPQFVESGQTLMEVLGRRREALQGVVRDTGTTFAAISRDATALQRMVTRTDEVLSTVAARREALAESIRIFPTFLDESRLTLTRVERFARDTDPLVRDLGPLLTDVQPTLRSLATFSPDAQRLFADLPALIAAGNEGLPALSRVLRGLDPTLASLGPFLQQLNPVLEFLELYQTTVSNFIEIGASALAIKLTPPPGQEQTNGHALPQQIVTGSQSFPSPNRTSDNRGNTYIPPDGYLFRGKSAENLVPPSFDCENSGGERRPGEQGPGCVVAPPIPFEGRSQKYPQVREARRGGLTDRPPGGG
jgi:phospholipid/cholesterol/gamma-HCH transport system substrate-binding protein